MSNISKLAQIDPSASIGSDALIGPFCVIGPNVEIGDNCELINNVSVEGNTRIGANNIFYQNVVIGAAPQDLKYNGGPTETIIGSNNVFRENCTVHRGTELGLGKTVIGNDNLFMVGVHIAHDCILEDGILMANQTMLAGHVKIEESAVIMALIGIHHFVTVGKYSYIGGMTPVHRDVPPFMKFAGDPNVVRGVNEEGLKRRQFSDEDVSQLKQAYRKLFRAGKSIAEQLDQLEQQDDLNKHVQYLCQFIRQSMMDRFGRYQEMARRDNLEQRQFRKPAEVRDKSWEKGNIWRKD
ncbi:MAG: acyl-ACP--UDP-N-acetylglucosamine O-acyltransferase [Planctomycetes bacterium]|nr:acyl-ACP--UDP-N-acetylglucosamine O-acyltransferase [Planctomycetota bacterium]